MSSDRPAFLASSEHISLDEFITHALKSAARLTAASQALPGEKKADWDYYSTFSGFRNVMRAERETVEGLINRILQWNGLKGGIGHRIGNAQDFLELLTDANDQILERINTNLDEAAGLKKKPGEQGPQLVCVSSPARPGATTNAGQDLRLLTAKNITRPQVLFSDLIDNSAKNVFIPRLQEKPNSKKPLSILREFADDNSEYYSHPYLYELNLLMHSEQQMGTEKPGQIVTLEEAGFTFVNSREQLDEMIKLLKKEPVIGVDTEHHSFRSFLGITSLIQISTPTQDFVIDPYPLWAELTALNEVFTDPSIVKVLHGAESEIQWLQRDFSVYLVNLFDTYLASKNLGFPPGCRSFAFLLKHYCSINTDKQYQLADWRIRPLPEKMLTYARTDTRYHIYIYRVMKNALLQKGNETKNLLRSTLDLGTDLCKARYEKPRLVPGAHLELLRKSRMTFNSRQVFALREVMAWRNTVAREEDESEAFVLPAHMLLKICSELPREMQGILACCNPIPPLVKQSLHPLHNIILKAREQALTVLKEDDIEASSRSNNEQLMALQQNAVEDPLRCPLDFGQHPARLSEKSVLIHQDREMDKLPLVSNKALPRVSVFKRKFRVRDASKKAPASKIRVFLSPYQRYQMLKPYLKFLSEKEDSSNQQRKPSDDERVRSIKEHFDALTAMTAEEYTANHKGNASDDDGQKSDADQSMTEELPLPEPVVRAKKEKKRAPKRTHQSQSSVGKNEKVAKRDNAEAAGAAADVNYEDADWKQFSEPSQRDGSNPKGQFNPWKGFQKNNKKMGKGNKQLQRYKTGGKSVTYKK